jgi:hypothetical protein
MELIQDCVESYEDGRWMERGQDRVDSYEDGR